MIETLEEEIKELRTIATKVVAKILARDDLSYTNDELEKLMAKIVKLEGMVHDLRNPTITPR